MSDPDVYKIAITLSRVIRLPNKGGNPRYWLSGRIGGDTSQFLLYRGGFETKPSSACAFDIDTDHVGRKVQLTIDSQGYVVGYLVDYELKDPTNG